MSHGDEARCLLQPTIRLFQLCLQHAKYHLLVIVELE